VSRSLLLLFANMFKELLLYTLGLAPLFYVFSFSPSDLPPEALLSMPVSFFGAAKVLPFFSFPNFHATFFNFFSSLKPLHSL
jgi:hypothetical protein